MVALRREESPDTEGYTIEMAEHLLPSDARFELHGGRIVLMSPARRWHSRIQRRVANLLEHQGRDVDTEIGLVIAPKESRVLDVAAFHGDAGFDRAYYQPGEIDLAVEVVSPSSERDDYVDKPDLYARLGIPEFWRIDRTEDGVVMVEMFTLDRDRHRYVAAKTVALDELEG